MKKQIQKKSVETGATKIADIDMYVLKLFVTGVLPNSVRAIVNAKAFCEQYLPGNYDLEIIDIYQQPNLASEEDIIAVPVLIKKFPLPEEMVIGDLSDIEVVLKGLNIFNS
ncbi:MAG: circadian clock KaiB family protein [Flavisolibacter sp.]